MPVSKKGKSSRIAPTSSPLRPAAGLDLNVDIVALHSDRIGPGWNHGRQTGDRPRLHVEAGAVGRALDVQPPQLTVAERVLLVGADVREGVVVAVLGVGEADLF